MLREDAMYKKSLAMATSDDERKQIATVVESFVSRFAEAVLPALQVVTSSRSKPEHSNVVTSGSVG